MSRPMSDALDDAPRCRSAEGWHLQADGTLAVEPQSVETLAEVHRRQTGDPRPDLVEDSRLWSRALTLEWHKDHSHVSLWSILFVLRCSGVRIAWRNKQDGDGRFLALSRGEMGEAEYEQDKRRKLLPYRETLAALMKHLAEEEKAVEGMEVVDE